MVCGFGDAASYETLVKRLAGASLDKASRFTDWAHRPVTERQIEYALADVVHLRTVYDRLQHLLAANGRAGWFEEEMADLVDPAIYRSEPAEAWRRFRIRGRADQRFLAVLRALAAWREAAAQQRDLPRGRIMRDEAVLEIAAHAPKTIETLARTRSLGKSIAEGKLGREILAAVAEGLTDPGPPPPIPAPAGSPPGQRPGRRARASRRGAEKGGGGGGGWEDRPVSRGGERHLFEQFGRAAAQRIGEPQCQAEAARLGGGVILEQPAHRGLDRSVGRAAVTGMQGGGNERPLGMPQRADRHAQAADEGVFGAIIGMFGPGDI